MKKILFVMLLLAGGVAQADDRDSLPNVAPTLRMAKIKGLIRKNFVERTENSVRVRDEDVCRFEGEVKVFDGRGSGYFVHRNVADCDSTLDGQPVKVGVQSYMVVQNMSSAGESATEAKFGGAILSVSRLGAPDPKVPQYASAGTRDLRSESILMSLQPVFFGGADLPAKEELFSATVEFVDDRQ